MYYSAEEEMVKEKKVRKNPDIQLSYGRDII